MIDWAGSGLWRMFECDSHCHERLAILSANYNQPGADLGGPEAANTGMAAGAKPGGGRMPPYLPPKFKPPATCPHHPCRAHSRQHRQPLQDHAPSSPVHPRDGKKSTKMSPI
jgi:hypothetical protein